MSKTPRPREGDYSSSGFDPLVESFIEKLGAQGYARLTFEKRRRSAESFVRWLQIEQIGPNEVRDHDAAAFLDRSTGRSQHRFKDDRAAVRAFLRHLRSVGRTTESPPSVPSASEELRTGYADYLRNDRDLADRSIEVYLPFVGDFIDETGIAADCTDLDAQLVRTFLLDRIEGRSHAQARLVSTTLRSFLRFLFLRGKTLIDLSVAVPTVRRSGMTHPQASLTPEQIEKIIATADAATAGGRRDRAILLLLARLGLRAGEVVGLELDDIRWRSAEIVVRGKGRRVDRMPLPADVGEALSLHLAMDRDGAASRRLFLRKIAPRVGLKGPAAVGGIVRHAMARAGVRKPGRGAAHLLRHSLATTMIRQGAELSEIAQVLRHRHVTTTQTYAKVDLESLRQAARPWPGQVVDR